MGNYSRLILFNINDLCIERDEVINWDHELRDELGYYREKGDRHFLNLVGIDVIDEPKIVMTDKKRLVDEMLKRFFVGYQIIDCQGKGSTDCGHPDFIVKNSQEEFFVELKVGEDCLRFNQLKWFCKNKDKKCKVLHIFIGLPKKSYYELSSPNSNGIRL